MDERVDWQEEFERYREYLIGRLADESCGDGLLILSAKVGYDATMRVYRSQVSSMVLDELIGKLRELEDKRVQEIIGIIRGEFLGYGDFKRYTSSNHARVFRECQRRGLVENEKWLVEFQRNSRKYLEGSGWVKVLIQALENKLCSK